MGLEIELSASTSAINQLCDSQIGSFMWQLSQLHTFRFLSKRYKKTRHKTYLNSNMCRVERPRVTWFKTIQHNLKSKNLSLDIAIDMVQNQPLWSMLSTFVATHSWWSMPEKNTICQQKPNRQQQLTWQWAACEAVQLSRLCVTRVQCLRPGGPGLETAPAMSGACHDMLCVQTILVTIMTTFH